MDFRASFSEMTPVRIRASAPIQPVMLSLMPISFVILGDGVVGQQLHAKGGIEEDADGEDGQAHDGVLEEA